MTGVRYNARDMHNDLRGLSIVEHLDLFKTQLSLRKDFLWKILSQLKGRMWFGKNSSLLHGSGSLFVDKGLSRVELAEHRRFMNDKQTADVGTVVEERHEIRIEKGLEMLHSREEKSGIKSLFQQPYSTQRNLQIRSTVAKAKFTFLS